MTAPKTKQTQALILILLAAFMVGTAVMSLEMLASRYLNPYFGGTIFTWAALISVVLLAMMAGYFIGGFSADKYSNGWVLEGMIAFAALYFIALPYFIDPMLEAIVSSVEDVKYGALLGSLFVTGLPVACLSTFSPMAIRRSLHDLDHTGRISGTIFAISTAGNIFGTLVTSFYLIPNFGTRSLTQSLSVLLAFALVILLLARHSQKVSQKGSKKAAPLLLAMLITPAFFTTSLLHQSEAVAAEKKTSAIIIESNAAYPEGPVYINGLLYYTEMTRNRVMKVETAGANNKPRLFFYQSGCGPTALAEYGQDKIVILCHLSDELVILNKQGKPLKRLKHSKQGTAIFHPNDCIKDDKGGVYITAPGHFHPDYQPMGHLFYLSAKGTVTHLKKDLIYPNGVAIYNNHLYVNEHLNSRVLKFPILKGSSLGKAEVFRDLKPEIKQLSKGRSKRDADIIGPDGIEIAKNGTVYIALYGAGNILVLDQKARLKRKIKTKAKYPTNITLTPKGHLIITGPNTLDTILQEGLVYNSRIANEDF